MNVIEAIEKEEIEKLTAERQAPEFSPGDTVRVNVRVVEGSRERVQAYEGVCIARKNAGLHSSFTVRKISYGEGVERVFPLFSPRIESIEVIRRGDVRRAKLYYMRGRAGKSARIREATDGYSAKLIQAERTAAAAAKKAADAEARAKAQAKAKEQEEAAKAAETAEAEAPAAEAAAPEAETKTE